MDASCFLSNPTIAAPKKAATSRLRINLNAGETGQSGGHLSRHGKGVNTLFSVCKPPCHPPMPERFITAVGCASKTSRKWPASLSRGSQILSAVEHGVNAP